MQQRVRLILGMRALINRCFYDFFVLLVAGFGFLLDVGFYFMYC